MEPIAIRKDLLLLPDDDSFVIQTYAEQQPEYIPLPAVVSLSTMHGAKVSTLTTMWKPSPSDLALLQRGAPITISIYGIDISKPIHPMVVQAGGANLR